jgi:NAD(P)-dependent dehydrogenase (short-subunit alcohol dehydrogenase family)
MVTGSNKGIGEEIVRLLADKGIIVVLTARCSQQQELSQQSRALMEEGRKNVVFHTLDIKVMTEGITHLSLLSCRMNLSAQSHINII